MSKVIFLLADGFEELELVAPYDILYRGGVTVTTVSISSNKEVLGAHGLKILADSLLSEIEGLPFDMVVLPGGSEGTENMIKNNAVKHLILESYKASKWVTAICAAPRVLDKVGLLGSHVVTSYPSLREQIEPNCKKYLDVPVVISGNIITSKGAGTAAELGFSLLSLLEGFEAAANAKGNMVF